MFSWKPYIGEFLASDHMQNLKKKILAEMQAGTTIYPRPNEWLNALTLSRFEDVKVVIIGQDPYHGRGQAHGLSFSVKNGVKTPPSLQNIYKEAAKDLGWNSVPSHGCLTQWAEQGVVMLNNVLTVEEGKPASHKGWGWEEFTDHVVDVIDRNHTNVVFMLWGKHAQKKAENVNTDKHLVLTAAHPSPFSADKGFFGCKHFSKANEYLISYGKQPVNWMIK